MKPPFHDAFESLFFFLFLNRLNGYGSAHMTRSYFTRSIFTFPSAKKEIPSAA